jgi:choline dehydrogenase-like flavoprotein
MRGSEHEEYDFIIVGAGSAGCVLSERLSKDAQVKVLLLEAGTATEPLAARIPVAYSRLFKTRHDWAYQTEPEPALDGRQLYMPRGKMLGGSSAMNAMIYIRGNPADYAGWVAEGARGWSYAEVLPFFMVSEDQARGASAEHGVGGPLRVEDPRSPSPLSAAFVQACVQRGLPRNPDFNGGAQEGAGHYQVTQKGGRRWSSANAYLFPALRRRNLTVRRGARVLGLRLEGDRAIGIDYTWDGHTRLARASVEVVLSAGAIGTPQLLMLSGIGPAPELERLGISVVFDSQGVGANLQDHPIAGIGVYASQPVSLRNATSLGALFQYVFSHSGPLSSNVGEAGAFVRSPGAQLPDIQYHFAPGLFLEHGLVQPRAHGFCIGPTLIAPRSRGHLSLRSSDPLAPPLIFGNHLSEPADMAALRWGIELAREIAAAPAFDAYRAGEFWPGSQLQGQADLERHIRSSVELLYHPCGTCRMGQDALSVVDPELRVHGIRGLRVADASVMPIIPRGNTHAPTVMIAERLAAWLQGRGTSAELPVASLSTERLDQDHRRIDPVPESVRFK